MPVTGIAYPYLILHGLWQQFFVYYFNNFTVVLHLIWFQFYYGLETVVYINACLGCKIIWWISTSNCYRMAILDWITKLLNAHQQQVLCYCCITLNSISVLWRLGNCCSHKCMSRVQNHMMNFNFKLLQGGHYGLKRKSTQRTSTTDVVLLLCYT